MYRIRTRWGVEWIVISFQRYMYSLIYNILYVRFYGCSTADLDQCVKQPSNVKDTNPIYEHTSVTFYPIPLMVVSASSANFRNTWTFIIDQLCENNSFYCLMHFLQDHGNATLEWTVDILQAGKCLRTYQQPVLFRNLFITNFTACKLWVIIASYITIYI